MRRAILVRDVRVKTTAARRSCDKSTGRRSRRDRLYTRLATAIRRARRRACARTVLHVGPDVYGCLTFFPARRSLAIYRSRYVLPRKPCDKPVLGCLDAAGLRSQRGARKPRTTCRATDRSPRARKSYSHVLRASASVRRTSVVRDRVHEFGRRRPSA